MYFYVISDNFCLIFQFLVVGLLNVCRPNVYGFSFDSDFIIIFQYYFFTF